MQIGAFNEFYQQFVSAGTEEKIDLYCTTENLTQNQYKQLLRTLTPSQFKKLERVIK